MENEKLFDLKFRVKHRLKEYLQASIVGIFHMDNTTTSKRTRAFLEQAEREGNVVPCDDLPKAFLLTTEYGFHRVHLTSLNTATLEKRLK